MKYLKTFGIVVFGIILFGLSGCQKEPSASFTTSKTTVVTGETITFTNTSKDGNDYEWNFGDGVTSVLANPTHSYENSGTYTVELTAYSKNGKKSNKASATITVNKANEIVYNGEKYPLTKGYIDLWHDPFEDIYELRVNLVDDGITITQDDEMGTGNLIFIEAYSSSPGLYPGTYTYSSSCCYAQTFDYGGLGINYDITNEVGTWYDFVGGTVTVSQSGTVYIIDATFTLANGKTVNAYYKGSLIYYNHTSKKSSKWVMRK